MIESFKLANFQRHRELAIELGPITTLIGPTDSGKSSVLRALKWLCLNKLSGSSFIRHGASECIAELKMDGGKTIKRTKGKSDNAYALDGQEYRAFGMSVVPPPIADLLQVGPDSFQGQHDAPYWLSSTAGQVSKELNEVVNLEIIDNVLSKAAAECHKAKLAVEVSQARLTDARERRDKLAWIVDFDRELAQAERLAEKREGVKRKLAQLTAITSELDRAERAAAVSIPSMDRIDGAVERWRENIAKQTELKTMLRGLFAQEDRICRANESQRTAEEALAKVKRCPTCGAIRT